MTELKQQIIDNLLTKTNTLNSRLISRDSFTNSQLNTDIQNAITFTDNLAEKIYCILHDISEKPICPICKSTKLTFRMFKHGYRKTCKNHSCIRAFRPIWESCSNTKKINSKTRKQKLLKHYENNQYQILPIETIKEFISARIKETDNGRNGRFICKLDDIDMLCSIIYYTKDLVPIDSKLRRWTERLYIIHNDLKQIPKCIICGDKNCLYTNFVKGYQKTCSTECVNNGYAQRCRIDSHFKQILPIIKKQNITILESPKGGLNSGRFKLKCEKCNKIFTYKLNNGSWKNIYCSGCGTSKLQKEITEYVKSLEVNYIENDRKILGGKELDIVIQDYNLALEIDGVYWHSELNGTKRNYHLNKTEMCRSLGIDLIHIFESDWVKKSKIVKSIIANRVGKNSIKISARNCEVKNIDPTTKKMFLTENHLQGDIRSSYNLGLFYKKELVSVMTFNKHNRANKSSEYEIVRSASRLNTTVIGGVSKLLKAFKDNYSPKTLITCTDRRYSSNNSVYEQIGFEFVRATKPNYWYFKGSMSLKPSISFQKNKLKSKLTNFDPNLSEWENMKANGYNRIWDCGNYVFHKEYNK